MSVKKRKWYSIPDCKDYDRHRLYTCPICGLNMLWFERNCAQHKEWHNDALDIIDQHGIYLTYELRESLKVTAYNICHHANDLEDKKFAFLLEWYSRFHRSLGSCNDIDKHPCFEDYISMILYQALFDDEDTFMISMRGRDVIESLADDFGTLKGIPAGSYFLKDYSNYKYSRAKYANAEERVRHGIPDDCTEPAIRRWVQGWLVGKTENTASES